MIAKTKSTSVRVSAVSETFVVPSSISQENILKALNELDRQAHSITVRVSGKQFIIAKRQRLINPFARALFGVVNQASHGSIVDYTFSVKPAVRILFSMWFALMCVVLITGISAVLTSGVSEFRLELVVLAVAFLLDFGHRSPVSGRCARTRRHLPFAKSQWRKGDRANLTRHYR